jgi:hypothetical protein
MIMGAWGDTKAKLKAAKQARKDAEAYVKANLDAATGALVSDTHKVFLFPDRIIRIGKGGLHATEEMPIAGVVAAVEDTGSVTNRGTLTRAATVGGGWQKESDTRQIMVTVEGPEFAWLFTVTPIGKMVAKMQAQQAREFAVAATLAGRVAERAQG